MHEAVLSIRLQLLCEIPFNAAKSDSTLAKYYKELHTDTASLGMLFLTILFVFLIHAQGDLD